MKIKHIILILLCLYSSCQGASKSDYITTATLTAAMSATTQANADSKAAIDVISKTKSGGSAGSAAIASATDTQVVPQNQFLLETQKAVLRSSLPETTMPNVLLNLVQEYLYARLYKFEAELKGHTKRVNTLIQLDDGRLVSGSSDYIIRVWAKNEEQYKCVAKLKGVSSVIYSVIKLKYGKLASCSHGNKILIWDLTESQDQQWIAPLTGHKSVVNSVIQLTDDKLASAGSDNTIRIWDLSKDKGDNPKNDQRCVQVLTSHTHGVYSVIQLKDGRLASGSDDGEIRIWDQTGNIDSSRLDLLSNVVPKEDSLKKTSNDKPADGKKNT